MISSHANKSKSSSTSTPNAGQGTKMNQTDKKQQKLNKLITQWSEMIFKDSELPTLAQKLNSNEQEDLHHGVIGLRKLLSKEDLSQIQPVIDTGVVPRLVELISPKSAKKIQLEAAWCLTNLCSGTTEQALYLIQNGAISAFISLLTSDDAELAEQSIFGLGNIAGESAEFRDLILKENGTEAMVKVLAKSSNINVKCVGAWALSNLCRGEPEPKFELVSSAIPILRIYQSGNEW